MAQSFPPTPSECESHLLCVSVPCVLCATSPWPGLGLAALATITMCCPPPAPARYTGLANQKPALFRGDQSESKSGVQDGDTGTGITSYHPASPCFTDCLPLQRGMISANQMLIPMRAWEHTLQCPCYKH